MEERKDRAIAELAKKSWGVFTSEHVAGLGFDDHHREFRVRTGRWELLHPTVYRIAGHPDTWHGRLLAACWATTGLVAASHRSAGALFDLPGGSRESLEITCLRWKRGFVTGLVVHETKLLDADDVTTLAGIPVTTIEQTLLGLAAVLTPPAAEIALDRALHRKLTTRARLDDFVRRKGARGRNGIGVLRELLRTNDPLAGVPESVMETKLKQLLRRHDLPMPEFQYEIHHGGRFVARVDAAYPELRIAIEYDSFEHHTGKQAIVRDNDRRNILRRIGWHMVTFTAADVQRDGGHAIEALTAAMGAAGP